MITQWQVVLRGTNRTGAPAGDGRVGDGPPSVRCDRRVLTADPRAATWWRDIRWLGAAAAPVRRNHRERRFPVAGFARRTQPSTPGTLGLTGVLTIAVR